MPLNVLRTPILLAALAVLALGIRNAAAQTAITFTAADGVVVHADRYGAGSPRGIVLAFHKAGSNRGEYDIIAPRLVRDGFEVIAVDQRSGGTLYGRRNETARLSHGSGGYMAALPDMEAALRFATENAAGRPIVVIGSSYSASLALILASRHPEIAAVALFSPGEYLGSVSVRAAAAQVTVPLFVTSAPDPDEIAAARSFVQASPARIKEQFVPTEGVHGASILRTDEDPRGAEAAWGALESFLGKVVPRRAS